MELLERGHAAILQRVFQPSGKIGDELVDGSSVSDSARDTLGNEDAVTLREVTSGTSVALLGVLATATGLLVLHGVDGTHAAVSLDELTLTGDERGTGRLGGAGKETTHHDGGGTKSEALDDVANVLDTTIGDARNTEASGERGNVVDGSSLGTANSHDLLGNAGRARAHADTETVNASSDQSSSLLTSNDVSADDIEVRELLLDPLDHLDLVHGVTLRAVKDNNVEASIDELAETVLVLGTGADSSGADELLGILALGGKGEVKVLGKIGARDHGDKVAVLVNDGELALLGLGKDLVGLEKIDTSGSGDQVSNHDLRNGLVKVSLELDVAVGDDANELGANVAGFYLKLSQHELPEAMYEFVLQKGLKVVGPIRIFSVFVSS